MAQLPTSWLFVVEVHVTVADGALLAIVVQHFSKSISIFIELVYVFGVTVSPGWQTLNLRLDENDRMLLP